MNNIAQPCPKLVFKFKKKLMFVTLMSLLIAVLLSGSLAGYIRTGNGIGILVFVVVFCFFGLVMCYLVCIGRSDIVIDNECIKRVFLGRTIRCIDWDNVKIVRVSPLAKWDSRRPVHAFNIIALNAGDTLPRTKRIYFGDYNTDVNNLIEIINFYILRNNISVECVVDGRIVVLKSISTDRK